MRYRLIALVGVLACVASLAVALPLAAHAGAPSPGHPGFDDTLFPHHWGKRNPTTGITPDPTGNSGYYYLNVQVPSPGATVHAAVWTSDGTWRIDFDTPSKKLLFRQVVTAPNEAQFPNAPAGQVLRVRFAHLTGSGGPDHGSAYTSESCAVIPPVTAVVPPRNGVLPRCIPDPGFPHE